MTQHRFLTDPDLHEPVGIAGATAGQVYISDGAGSGAWTNQANGAPGGIYEDVKAAGTDGGTFTGGAWRTRTLNTETRNTIGAALASNQITLLAGTYYVEWEAVAYGDLEGHQSRFRNVTDATTVASGTSENGGSASTTATRSTGCAVFTIASTKVFELQHYCFSTVVTTGFGNAADLGESERYALVKIWLIS